MLIKSIAEGGETGTANFSNRNIANIKRLAFQEVVFVSNARIGGEMIVKPTRYKVIDTRVI